MEDYTSVLFGNNRAKAFQERNCFKYLGLPLRERIFRPPEIKMLTVFTEVFVILELLYLSSFCRYYSQIQRLHLTSPPPHPA